MTDNAEPHSADLAALLGAAVTILLTLTFGQGAWGPISTIVGLLILFMLFGYFWQQRPDGASFVVDWAMLAGAGVMLIFTFAIPPGVVVRILVGIFVAIIILFTWRAYGFASEKRRRSMVVGAAFSVVVGLVAAVTFAQAFQVRWFSDGTGHPTCLSVALAQATTAVRDLNGASGNPGTLPTLVGQTVMNGAPEQPVEMVQHTSDAVKNAFYDQYEGAIGDCLASETFEQLWWVGAPFSLLTLAWWTLSRKKLSGEDEVLDRVCRKVRHPLQHTSNGGS